MFYYRSHSGEHLTSVPISFSLSSFLSSLTHPHPRPFYPTLYPCPSLFHRVTVPTAELTATAHQTAATSVSSPFALPPVVYLINIIFYHQSRRLSPPIFFSTIPSKKIHAFPFVLTFFTFFAFFTFFLLNYLARLLSANQLPWLSINNQDRE